MISMSNDYPSSALSMKFKLYFVVSFILILFASIFIYVFIPPYAYAQIDSVRYLLSTIVSSLATIIAIVISMSLVVIELTASSYSTRVIDMFKQSPAIWIVISTYILAIVYGMTVLKFLDVIAQSGLAIYETTVWIAFFISIVAFGALIPYILSSLDIMKPSTVINRFAERVTRENILTGISESENIVARSATSLSFSYLHPDILRPVTEIDKDPIQPIIDMIHGSMMKYDYETTRYGLKILENYLIDLLNTDDFDNDNITITKHIFIHLERVGKLGASRDDEDSVLEVTSAIFMIGKKAVHEKIENITGESINSLKNICRVVIKREHEDSIVNITDFIADIGRDAVKYDLDFAATVSINSLGIIGRATTKLSPQDLEVTVGIAGTIEEIGILSIKHSLNQSVFHAVNSLGDVGKLAITNNLVNTTLMIIDYLYNMGVYTLKANMNHNTNRIAEYLWEIGRIAIWNEMNILALDKLINKVKDSLQKLMDLSQELGHNETATIATLSLDKIENLIQKTELNDN